jgi:hypothetical protein
LRPTSRASRISSSSPSGTTASSRRADVEGDHKEIEEWEFRDGRVFASVGSMSDEAHPDRGHGWMCRLADAGALAAAGFVRVRKADLLETAP